MASKLELQHTNGNTNGEVTITMEGLTQLEVYLAFTLLVH